MIDSRELHIKYFELKVKLLGDIDSATEAESSLRKKSLNPNDNKENKQYYELWANIVANNTKAYKESLSILNQEIKNLQLEQKVNEMIDTRNKKKNI